MKRENILSLFAVLMMQVTSNVIEVYTYLVRERKVDLVIPPELLKSLEFLQFKKVLEEGASFDTIKYITQLSHAPIEQKIKDACSQVIEISSRDIELSNQKDSWQEMKLEEAFFTEMELKLEPFDAVNEGEC